MTLSCPKCGQEQADSAECIRCGLIFKKFCKEPVMLPLKNQDSLNLRQIIEELKTEKERLLAFFRRFATERNQRLVTQLMLLAERGRKWLRGLLDIGVTFVLYFVIAWIISVVLYGSVQAIWYLYQETPVGKQFLVYYPLKAQVINKMVAYDALFFMFQVCLLSAAACLMAGAAARLLFLMRLFYEGRGLVLKFFVWPLVCAFCGAWPASMLYNIDLVAGFVLMVFPSLFLCYPCFKLVGHCLPEINFLWPVQKIQPLVLSALNPVVHKFAGLNNTIDARDEILTDADNTET